MRRVYLDHIAATPLHPQVLEAFPPIIKRLRKMSPLYTKYLEEKEK